MLGFGGKRLRQISILCVTTCYQYVFYMLGFGGKRLRQNYNPVRYYMLSVRILYAWFWRENTSSKLQSCALLHVLGLLDPVFYVRALSTDGTCRSDYLSLIYWITFLSHAVRDPSGSSVVVKVARTYDVDEVVNRLNVYVR